MRIIIHRGSHQIGGSCIEIASGGTRIVLDAGLPLDADPNTPPALLPVDGLFGETGAPIDALFLSHSHADHSGLISSTRNDVPVWMSTGTSKMIMAGSIFARQPVVLQQRTRFIESGVPIDIGSIRVTAYTVDHSVYDAMAFLVEADGKRILYTGDLRFHGRKSGMMQNLVKVARATPIDALLIEGTRLGNRAIEKNLSEQELETQMAQVIREAPSVVLGMYSPLNVDRFVTYFKATRRAGRIFVIDPYQAFVLHLINRPSLPRPENTPDLEVLVSPRYSSSRAGRILGDTAWGKRIGNGSVSAKKIRETPDQFVAIFRESMQPWLYPSGLPHRTTCMFSYWPGYLKDLKLKKLRAEVEALEGTFLQHHASGHAHRDDLFRFVKQVRPHMLIPIHSNSPESWSEFWPNTFISTDGTPIVI